jgi:membrane protein DedA with SNARE-associated domain
MEAYIEHFGYLAVLIGTFLEGETVLVLAGFAAHRGYLQLFWVIFAAFAGTLLGDQLFYYIGRRHSQAFLKWRPYWQPRIEKAEGLIKNHQILIILAFRFLYGMRTVTPFALGIAKVPAKVFVPLNVVGALAWAICFGSLGYLFGQALEKNLGSVKKIEIWVMAGIATIGCIIWLVRFLRARRDRSEPPHS